MRAKYGFPTHAANRIAPVLRLILLFSGLAFYGNRLMAQDSTRWKGVGLEMNLLGEKIIRHSVKFTTPIPPASGAMELNLFWQSWGKKPWQKRLGYPITGVGIMVTDYGSRNIFGRCVSVYPNMQVPLIRGRKLEWTFRFGVGLGYVDRHYSTFPHIDTVNKAVSTNLNAFACYLTDLRYHLNDQWDLQAGANFSHISNALYREPNLGVNTVGAHVGLRYFPASAHPAIKLDTGYHTPANRWLTEVRGAIAFKEARAKGNPVKPTYVAAVAISRRLWGCYKIYAGFDAAYHKDVYAFLLNYDVNRGYEKRNSWDGGVFLGNELMVGKVGLVVIVGAYYEQTFLAFDPIYEKLGGKYYLRNSERGFVKEWFLSALLNTHGAVAEYAEFGMGMAF